ncbi:hypothetical protein E2562_017958 [Oryza meyeriana var. granulata]|uniref:F-box domain-containing protein n=1 Tax=Oryza meyeriana var. granulata TaxID=110450 RepID=A0A6G1F8T2_9ORYZ|nr:hypothetical protein E2562_017958 [Oryza meyeriana var. granulata]
MEQHAQLPDHVVLDIVSYLPAKSVGRFRTVSRSWLAALSAPFFLDLYLLSGMPTTRPQSFSAVSVKFDSDSEDEASLDDDGEKWCFYAVQLRGALCVACSNRDANTIDVWSMNNDATAWSMEYHMELAAYSPEYSSEKTTVMGVDPTNGRIWLTTWQSLGHYDPKTGELVTEYRARWMNQPEALNGWMSRFCAVICQESLIRYPFEPLAQPARGAWSFVGHADVQGPPVFLRIQPKRRD